MKKILDEFLTKKGTTILKSFSSDFQEFVTTEYPDIDKKEASNFFFEAKREKQEKAKKYEEQHLRKTIRFSVDEFAIIEEQLKKASIKNFSQWAKSVLLKRKIKLPIEQERITQLSKIGTNLNQIAHKLNAAENIDTELVTKTLKKLIAIEQEIKELK